MDLNQRIAWIDVAKFLGIFAIYLGHFNVQAGKAYLFVFSFHVPLFFFLSGCVASLREEELPLKNYVVRKLKSILIPYYIFMILSTILYVIVTDSGLVNTAHILFDGIIKGAVRNSFFAISLWFLTCLFLMEIFIACLGKIMNRYAVFLVCVLLHIIFLVFLKQSYPSLWYNIDSVANYAIYYSIGYCAFPAINRFFSLNSEKKKIIFSLTGFLAFAYSALVYGGHSPVSWVSDLMFTNTGLLSAKMINDFLSVVGVLITIYLVLVVARLFANITFFQEIGSNTLYLCGNEYIIKALVSYFVGIFGINISFPNPFSAYIYTFVLLVLCNRYLVPLEKPLLQCVTAKMERIGHLIQRRKLTV